MRKRNKLLAIGLSVIMTASGLSGCGSSSSSETAATPADTTVEASSVEASATSDTEAEGEGINLVLRNAAELASMDGSLITSGESMTVFGYTTEGLYKYGPSGDLELGMADSVDISEDGLTYTFHIRDAVWSNGTPVTANDFEYSWKRLANPDTGATYAFMLYTAGIKNAYAVCYEGADLDTLGVTAVDDKTLVVELDRPVAYFPSLMPGTYFRPINQEFCEAQGDQYGLTMNNCLACGPYILTEWEPGGTVTVLTKNEDYYAASDITVDTITYEVIKDNQQAIMSWESGTIDNISLTGDLVSLYQNDEAYMSKQASMLWYIAVNEEVAGLDNADLRLALALCYDKQAICDNILKNGSIPANFCIPENFAIDQNGQYFRDAAGATYLETNKELALEHYNKACEELGTNSFTFELLYDDAEDTKNIAQFLQSEIQSTLPGVTIELKVQPKNNRVEMMTKHDFKLGLTRWGADYDDATTYLDMWTTGNNYNYGSYHNEEYDELVNAVSGELAADPDARVENMIKAEKIIMDEAGILPVYQVCNAYLVNPEYNVVFSSRGGFLWQYTTRK